MWSRNCPPFQSTWLHRRIVWGSSCSIFSFLCNVLYSIICLLFFFFEPLFYMSFDFPLLISPLVSLSSLTQYSTLFKSNKSQKKMLFFHCGRVLLWVLWESHFPFVVYKKSLKIPKEQSESVYRRTDNTMAKRKSTKDKQRYTKHTHKTKDRVTRTPLKTGDELRCSGMVSSSCSTSDTR